MRRMMLGLLMWSSLSAATAGPLEDADAAYDRKNYAEALKLFRRLADKGNAFAQ